MPRRRALVASSLLLTKNWLVARYDRWRSSRELTQKLLLGFRATADRAGIGIDWQ